MARAAVVTDADAVFAACAAFVGEIEQVPPMHSALKRDGRALYEYARDGVTLEREARRLGMVKAGEKSYVIEGLEQRR